MSARKSVINVMVKAAAPLLHDVWTLTVYVAVPVNGVPSLSAASITSV
jgi:hypothetical protein